MVQWQDPTLSLTWPGFDFQALNQPITGRVNSQYRSQAWIKWKSCVRKGIWRRTCAKIKTFADPGISQSTTTCTTIYYKVRMWWWSVWVCCEHKFLDKYRAINWSTWTMLLICQSSSLHLSWKFLSWAKLIYWDCTIFVSVYTCTRIICGQNGR